MMEVRHTLVLIFSLYFSATIGAATPDFVCHDGDTSLYFVGLRPVKPTKEDDLLEACESFWHCRQPSPDQTQKHHFSPRVYHNGLWLLAPDSELFRCADADPTKKYFDARTCECVETPDHCASNQDFEKNCSRGPINIASEKPEACRHWGPAGEYYQGLFTDYDQPTKHWHCGAGMNNTATPHNQPCPSGLANGVWVIWNQEKCLCDIADEKVDDVEAMFKKSKHPMFRTNCLWTEEPEP